MAEPRYFLVTCSTCDEASSWPATPMPFPTARRVKDGEGWAADASVIFDPATWTSIVTAVSAFPDDSATHAGAVALHGDDA